MLHIIIVFFHWHPKSIISNIIITESKKLNIKTNTEAKNKIKEIEKKVNEVKIKRQNIGKNIKQNKINKFLKNIKTKKNKTMKEFTKEME